MKILVIPDCQVKPDIPLDWLGYIGQYAARIKPEIVVCGGDFADMESLSSYEKPGSKSFEGKRYKHDIQAARDGMEMLMTPIVAEQERLKRNKEKQWNPRLVMTLGNHEDRITRAINSNPQHLDGIISLADLEYEKWGWEVHPFLEVVNVSNILFSHFFVSGNMGRPICSASQLLTKKHMSCFAFHQQGRQVAHSYRGDGVEITGIICGSAYEHDEAYMGPQGNVGHWRGVYLLTEVTELGTFDQIEVSLKYLRKKYGSA